MRKELKIAGAGLVSLAAVGCSQQGANQQQKPNIIYILCDDLGYECIDAYGGTYGTPAINQMARDGILFRNMHAMPLSSPSRVQTMTGQYNYRNYVAFGYINPDENTFGHLAQQAGYATAMVGKFQLGRQRELPGKLGFDEWFLNQVEMYKEFSPSNGKYTDRFANSYWDNNGKSYELSLYGPDDCLRYAFDFIDRQAEADKPFFLYYSDPLVHTPHVSTPDSECWDTEYNTRFEGDTRHFPDMVQYMDKLIGKLVDKLKADGLWDNTLIVFTTDNGTSTRIHSKMQDGSVKQGGKGTTLDNGTHVPLVITWGDKIKGGQVSERLVDLTDFMPTFADAMGVDIPADWTTDGISLYPELVGDTPLEKKFTICNFNPAWPMAVSPRAARLARTVKYKLYDNGDLFDVEADFFQQNPIPAGKGSPEAEAARKMLRAELDKLPEFIPEKGVPRRGDYGTFYDFAMWQDPF